MMGNIKKGKATSMSRNINVGLILNAFDTHLYKELIKLKFT